MQRTNLSGTASRVALAADACSMFPLGLRFAACQEQPFPRPATARRCHVRTHAPPERGRPESRLCAHVRLCSFGTSPNDSVSGLPVVPSRAAARAAYLCAGSFRVRDIVVGDEHAALWNDWRIARDQ